MEVNVNGNSSSGTGHDTHGQANIETIIKKPQAIESLKSRGISTANAFQAQAVPAILSRKDTVAIGSRGSGKTLAYGIALADLLESDASMGAAVVTCSSDYAKAILSRLDSVGISSVLASEAASKPSARVVIGTPDAVLGAVGGGFHSGKIGWVVLDDLGDLLTPQGQQETEELISKILDSNKNAQLILISKTLSNSLASIVKSTFREPTKIGLDKERADESVHLYYEVGGDLLAKPSLLANLINHHSSLSMAIFCNSPSDADFVEVMLRKRNIESKKLIGNVPSFKIEQALADLKEGGVRALILTDVSAKSFEVEEVDILINYSIPSDPEIYIHRLGRSGIGGAKGLVISLVGPLDIANFHYLKKFVGFEFAVGEEPPKQSNAGLVLKALEGKAQTQDISAETKEVIELILKHEKRDSLIAALLSSHANAGSASNNSQRRSGRSNDDNRRGDDSEWSESRHSRRDRNGGRRGRDFSDDSSEGDYSDSSSEGSSSERGSRSHRSNRDGGDEGRSESHRQGGRERHHANRLPPVRFSRLYLGASKASKLGEGELRELFAKGEGLQPELLKRFQQRERYAFVDVPEEITNRAVEHLNSLSLKNSDGSPVLVMRATTINEPRAEDSAQAETTSSEMSE